MLIKRICMQEADASPGSGQAPVPAPTEPQAQGAAATPDIGQIVSDALRQQRDSIFAELRRSGVLGSEKKSKSTETPAPPAAHQPDLGRLRQLDRALARTPHASRLNDAAYARLERAFVDEAPSDASQWLADYFEGMGIAQHQAAPSAATAAPAPARSATPVSDGGTPPAPRAPLEDRDILSLSKEDRDHLIKQKGPKWYIARVLEQNKGKSVSVK